MPSPGPLPRPLDSRRGDGASLPEGDPQPLAVSRPDQNDLAIPGLGVASNGLDARWLGDGLANELHLRQQRPESLSGGVRRRLPGTGDCDAFGKIREGDDKSSFGVFENNRGKFEHQWVCPLAASRGDALSRYGRALR